MKLKWSVVLLALIFLIVLGVRLFFAFQTPMVSMDSYFSLRQIEHISSTGAPLYNDPLSYGGRVFIFPPLFYYLVALFQFLFTTTLAAKLIANILAASLVVIAFLIVKKITSNDKSALVTALLAGFLPALMNTTFDVTPVQLALPIFFLIIYCFLDLNNTTITWILLLMLFLVLTSPIALLLVCSLLVYLLLSRVEGFTPNKKEIELSLFFIFLAFWSSLIIYKKALFVHGLSILSYNIPQTIANNVFQNITFLETFVYIGILSLILGIYGAFLGLSKQKSKSALLLISVVITFFLALFLKIIPLETGLLFLGAALTLFAGMALVDAYILFTKSKLAKFLVFAVIFFFLLFGFLEVYPSLLLVSDTSQLPQEADFEALAWAKMSTPNQSLILGHPEEGHLIAYASQRKNMMDTNYLAVPLIDQRYADLSSLYKTPFQTLALPLIHYYNINYLYLSSRTKTELNISTIKYIEENCFTLIYNKTALIYEVTCNE